MSIKYLNRLKDRSILPILEDDKPIDNVDCQNCNFEGVSLSNNDLNSENLEALLRSGIKTYEMEIEKIKLLKKYASDMEINNKVLTPGNETVELSLEQMNFFAHKSLNTLLRMLLNYNKGKFIK